MIRSHTVILRSLIVFILSGCFAALHAEDVVRNPDRVAYLQARLLELEGTGSGMSATQAMVEPVTSESTAVSEESEKPAPLATGWQNAAAWERLELGMSPSEVVAILGQPEKTLNSLQSGVNHVYYYERSIHRWSSQLRGQVEFDGQQAVEILRPKF